VQVSGDVVNPAVYGFEENPDTAALLRRAGGVQGYAGDCMKSEPGRAAARKFLSGMNVEVVAAGSGCRLLVKDMPAFYRITLGLPVYLNRETCEGLNAVPGIGPKLATAIVNYRNRIGGFNRIEEILSVQGIGRNLYEKIKPYLDL
jgi:competence protein ComEA